MRRGFCRGRWVVGQVRHGNAVHFVSLAQVWQLIRAIVCIEMGFRGHGSTLLGIVLLAHSLLVRAISREQW
jgi:hypothetical protein